MFSKEIKFMTKIKLISDIHVDCGKQQDKGFSFIDSLPNDNVDVLVLAGDIVTGGELENYFDTFKYLCDKYKEVVFVLGNHDYYGHSISETQDIAKTFAGRISNLHYLQNERKNISGQWFVGTTLWFPEIEHMPGKFNWIDFRLIPDGSREIFKEHIFAREYLQNNLQEGDVLITHHIPNRLLVHSRYKGDSYNCYFVGHIGDIIQNKKPSHVLFGHSHLSVDKEIAGIRYILNPRAYPHEWDECGFDKEIIIDTELDKKYT